MTTSGMGQPDPLLIKMLADGQGLSTDERLDHLIEFVAQLNDRIEALEGHVTALVTRTGDKGLGH